MEKTELNLEHPHRFYPYSGFRGFSYFSPKHLLVDHQKQILLQYEFLYDKNKQPLYHFSTIDNYRIDICRYNITINDVYNYLDSWKSPYERYKRLINRIHIRVKIILGILFFIIGIFLAVLLRKVIFFISFG